MIEWFLIVTPIVMLAVVALLAFNSCSFSPGQASLATPGNLRAEPGDGQIMVSWDSVTDAGSYTLTRSTPDIQGSTPISIPGVQSTSFMDTNVVRGTRYCYTAKAVSTTQGTSKDSNQGCATPFGLVAHAKGAATGQLVPATTNGVDTTGASLLILSVVDNNHNPATDNVSDSFGNTWQPLQHSRGPAGATDLAIWYAWNHAGGALTVCRNHTATGQQGGYR